MMVGLAISGGVDSMALAWLCSAMSRRDRRAYEFTAFVVDHKLRKGSTKEASQVSKALTRMGMRVLITCGTRSDPLFQVCTLGS